MTCGLNAIPDGVVDYAFYHAQDADRLKEENSVHLCYGGDFESSDQKRSQMR
jgi:hypothetical protein